MPIPLMHHQEVRLGTSLLSKKVCGDCRYFIVERERDVDSVGRCKFGKFMGVYPSTRDACTSFARPGDDRLPQMKQVVRTARTKSIRMVHADYAPMLPVEATRSLLGEDGMSKAGVFQVLAASRRSGAQILEESDGMISIEPRDTGLQSKDVPIDQFCNKLFMMHGNLRVLEQKMLTYDGMNLRRQFELVEQICLAKSGILSLAQPSVATDEITGNALLLVQEMEWNGLVNGRPSLSEKYRGGTVTYGSEIIEPIEQFFHRLCRLKDGLMIAEMMIEDLFGSKRTEIQNYLAYIRKCYGTLKTFNILFANRDDYFTT